MQHSYSVIVLRRRTPLNFKKYQNLLNHYSLSHQALPSDCTRRQTDTFLSYIYIYMALPLILANISELKYMKKEIYRCYNLTRSINIGAEASFRPAT